MVVLIREVHLHVAAVLHITVVEAQDHPVVPGLPEVADHPAEAQDQVAEVKSLEK